MDVRSKELSPEALENLHVLATVATMEERSIAVEATAGDLVRQLAIRKHALSFGASVLVVDELVENPVTGSMYKDSPGEMVRFHLDLGNRVTKFRRLPRWYEASGGLKEMLPSHRKEQKRRTIRAAERLAGLVSPSLTVAEPKTWTQN